MGHSKARRLAFVAAEAAVKKTGTSQGQDAATVALALALLELSHQVRRLGEQMPVYGPPEER